MEKFRVEMKIGLSDKRGSIVGQKTKKIGEFFCDFDEKFVLMQKSEKEVD